MVVWGGVYLVGFGFHLGFSFCVFLLLLFCWGFFMISISYVANRGFLQCNQTKTLNLQNIN